MRRPPKLAVTSADPLVQRLFLEMAEQQIGVVKMGEKSGLNKNTLKDWRTRSVPRVNDLRAAFNVLGLDLVVRQLH